MQVELFKAPNLMFVFSLRLASVQERKVNHSLVYFDLKIQYHSFAVSGLSDKISQSLYLQLSTLVSERWQLQEMWLEPRLCHVTLAVVWS